MQRVYFVKKLLFLLPLLFITSGCAFLDMIIGNIEEVGCRFTSGKTQDHCYKDAANRQNDADVCDKVKGLSDVGNAPKNQCYQDLAMKNKDPTYCDRIVNPGVVSTTKEACQAVVEKVSPGSPAKPGQCTYDSDCRSICEGNTFWKQGCDAQTNTCVKTFDTPCIQETISDFEFQQLCTKEVFVRNTQAI